MLKALDHVTLRTTDLDRSLAFYVGRLGLALGPRPPVAVPGAWLHLAGRPVLHLVERAVAAHQGPIDHLAFDARGRAALASSLDAAGVPFDLVALPDGTALQMFLHDPDGARIELVFRLTEDR